jgi:hypothetical protein
MPRREPTDIPPSRWRVVERNRRLEVIDTHTGERLAPPRPAEPLPPRSSDRPSMPLLRQTRFDGGGELTTHRLFDERAPRTIALDAGSAATVSRIQIGLPIVAMVALAAVALWPWLLALLVLPFRGEVRRPFRRRITAWLDRVEREAS